MKLLDTKKLAELASALKAKGWRVVAPIADGDCVRLKEWAAGAVLRLDEVPVNSAKEFLLPRSEVLARYRIEGNDFASEPVAPEAVKTVVLGARPCDAASLAALDTVFNWDYKDVFYNAHRAAVTLVTLACTSAMADDQCFCTSVGGSPDSTRGADAILRPAGGGAKLIFEPLTDKGHALAADAGPALADGEAKADRIADVPVRFSSEAVTEWLKSNFESPLWKDVALACLGCGACAYACPTCHCFDIQDEGSRKESVRYRNWDSCGLALFTLHASGHNPRPDQSSRWRQRVMHKFSYFPDRFGMLGCTGCGRCARLCPAGMAIAEVCEAIERASKVPVK